MQNLLMKLRIRCLVVPFYTTNVDLNNQFARQSCRRRFEQHMSKCTIIFVCIFSLQCLELSGSKGWADTLERIGNASRKLPISTNLVLEKIAGDYDGCEGPLWVDDNEGGYLLYGAVHTNITYIWREDTGASELKNPSNEASAFKPAPDKLGTFIVAEQTTRRIVRYEKDGSTSLVADRYQGKRFNRPNDIAIHSNGSVWFTDPDYLFRIRPEEIKELDAQHIFRIDLKDTTVRSMDVSLDKPNGIAFTPDEKHLLVSDSSTNKVFRWAASKDGLGPRSVFVELPQNRLDGIRFDWEGNLWVAAADSVFIVSPEGEVFAKISMPIQPTAIEFGGPDRRTPFITTRQAVFRLVNPSKD
jgi:gluconolactonase